MAITSASPGAVERQQPLAGSATITSATTGSVTGSDNISGTASATSLTAGSAALGASIASAVSVSSSTAGAVDLFHNLAGTASASASAVGAITISASNSAPVGQNQSLEYDVDEGGAYLASTVSITSSTTGSLVADMSGSATITTTTTGDITVSGGSSTPQIRGFADNGNSTAWTSSTSVTLPTNQSGDLLLVGWVSGAGTSTPNTPSGWTSHGTWQAEASNDYLTLFSKTSNGSESLTITSSGNADCSAFALSLTGGSVGNVGTLGGGGNTVTTSPDVTVAAGDLSLGLIWADGGATFVPSPNGGGTPGSYPADEGFLEHTPDNKSTSVEVGICILQEASAGNSTSLSWSHLYRPNVGAQRVQITP